MRVVVERAVIPVSISTKEPLEMFISQVWYFVLASIGAEVFAYSPVIVLGLYVSLHEDRTGVEAPRSVGQSKGEPE